MLLPDYALAYSGIAAANGLLALFGIVSGGDAYPEMKASAERGYALDLNSGETCTVVGGLYERALKLQPGHAAAHQFRATALLCKGNIEAADSGLRRSTELDPLSASDCARMAYLHYVKADYRSAAEDLQQSFELDRDYPEVRFYEGPLQYQEQNYDRVIQYLSASDIPLEIGVLTAAFAWKGCESRAQECFEKLDRMARTQYVTPLAELLLRPAWKISM
jgi:adenylate cyclase